MGSGPLARNKSQQDVDDAQKRGTSGSKGSEPGASSPCSGRVVTGLPLRLTSATAASRPASSHSSTEMAGKEGNVSNIVLVMGASVSGERC